MYAYVTYTYVLGPCCIAQSTTPLLPQAAATHGSKECTLPARHGACFKHRKARRTLLPHTATAAAWCPAAMHAALAAAMPSAAYQAEGYGSGISDVLGNAMFRNNSFQRPGVAR